ncbi:Predicted arabinose efflux permease, MFS family [Streptomyces sp. TLI_053]|uniref:MFS transporter n=1 Tax=Streptomyces sp. TLI_053 TaxID=1855352 RepID=UPI00087B4A1C|nr:MFS transporter [Streptomyces sp. TLI_053]SDT78517.1 Predicted arabinose efflux permease, MFS family [Streptomyces sp. TLI_053]
MISSAPLVRRLPPAYRPLFAPGPFRRLLPALAVSDLGDGMSAVAVPWLALQLAPPGQAGLFVGAAVAAYVLPGALGALLLGRWLRGLPARRLIRADAWTRAVLLGAVPVGWASGVLAPWLLLALLAGSSLLHGWGASARYALVAEVIPAGHRLAANALLSTSGWVAMIAGPALAGTLTAVAAPAWVIGLDALSFAVLAVGAGRLSAAPAPVPVPDSARDRTEQDAVPRGEGLRVLRARPQLLALLALTWLFNLAWGPVEVALPLFVGQELAAGPGLLGAYWAAFGVGAVLGALAVGMLRGGAVRRVLLGIVAAHGVALLSFAPPGPAAVSVAGFAVAGVVYGPYGALSLRLFQDLTPPPALTSVLALRSSVLMTASPAGATLGGPLTAVLGPRAVLVGAGLVMIAVAGCAAVAPLLSGRLARGKSAGPTSGAVAGPVPSADRRESAPGSTGGGLCPPARSGTGATESTAV